MTHKDHSNREVTSKAPDHETGVLADIVVRVRDHGERVVLLDGDQEAAVVISIEDLALLEKIEGNISDGGTVVIKPLLDEEE